MMHLLLLARIPVAIAGGALAAHGYLRLVWWAMARREDALDVRGRGGSEL